MPISLKDIISRCGSLSICEEREVTDIYCEIVFYTKDTPQWEGILSEIFGSPAKPQGASPTKNDLALTMDFGGVFDNQTLFKQESENSIVLAMFWPWGNGEYTTLKLAVLNKTS